MQTVKNREIRSLRWKALHEVKKRLPNAEFHENNRGGLLEIRQKNFHFKIRITKEGWQLEKWTRDNKLQEMLHVHIKPGTYEELIMKFHSSINESELPTVTA